MARDKKALNKLVENIVKKDLLIWQLTDSILDTMHLIEKGISNRKTD